MKQYTNEIQTAKLIELGVKKPWRNEYLHILEEYGYAVEEARNFSIGELIEMLGSVSELEILREGSGWGAYDELRAFSGEELIDALYDMILQLKGE